MILYYIHEFNYTNRVKEQTMCYYKLAKEYFSEAQRLNLHIKKIKKLYGKPINIENDRDTYYRIKTMYTMYLELKHVGEYLLRKSRRDRNGN